MTDTSLGATWRNIHALGYAATSATCPDRRYSRSAMSAGQRDSFLALSDHPGAVMLCPNKDNGCDLEDASKRHVALLIVTGYLNSFPEQSKAVHQVLSDYGLNAGPMRVDRDGGQVFLLQYDGEPMFNSYRARLCFEEDEDTVRIQHAIKPVSVYRQDMNGVMCEGRPAPGSHVLPLEGEWRNGSPLDTRRSSLPQLTNVELLIADIERARWAGRPAAVRSKAAAA